MLSEEDKTRLEGIFEILLELSRGNLLYALERTENKDQLEALTLLINMTLEEVKAAFVHQSYVNQQETYEFFTQIILLVDERFIIENFNDKASKLLFIPKKQLKGQKFENLLTDASKRVWKKQLSIIQNNPYKLHRLPLTLRTGKQLYLPTSCLITGFSFHKQLPKILISCVEIVSKAHKGDQTLLQKINALKKNPTQQQKKYSPDTLRPEDIKKMREARAYILAHLDESIGSLRELGLMLGTNEFKLKKGFKTLYNTSVFRFQKQQRLRQAKMYLLNTELQIKLIARKVGFNSAEVFTRAFKKYYGYSPRDLRSKFK